VDGSIVTMSNSEDKYLCLKDDEISSCTKNEECSKFKVEIVGGNQIRFNSYGKYLKCSPNGEVSLCDKRNNEEFETWQITAKNPKNILIKSFHDSFLTIDENGKVECTKEIDIFEPKLFWKIKVLSGNKIAIKTCFDTFLSANENGKVTQSKNKTENETFTVEFVATFKSAFLSKFGTYLSANKQTSEISLSATEREKRETFSIEDIGGKITIKSQDGQYLRAENDEENFSMTEMNKEWELFQIVPIKES